MAQDTCRKAVKNRFDLRLERKKCYVISRIFLSRHERCYQHRSHTAVYPGLPVQIILLGRIAVDLRTDFRGLYVVRKTNRVDISVNLPFQEVVDQAKSIIKTCNLNLSLCNLMSSLLFHFHSSSEMKSSSWTYLLMLFSGSMSP